MRQLQTNISKLRLDFVGNGRVELSHQGRQRRVRQLPRLQQAALLDGATPPQLPSKNSHSSKLSSEHFGVCVLFGFLPLLWVIC